MLLQLKKVKVLLKDPLKDLKKKTKIKDTKKVDELISNFETFRTLIVNYIGDKTSEYRIS